MRFNRLTDGKQYGYILRNCFTGEVLCEREFDSREEMEKMLTDDLARDAVIGRMIDTFPRDKEGK